MYRDLDLEHMFDDILNALDVGKTARFDLDRAHQVWGELTSKYHEGTGTTLKPWADKMADRYEIKVFPSEKIVTATRTK